MLTSIFSRLVITFGEQSLPAKTLVEEVVIGICIVIPLGALLGHLTIRMASMPPKFVRADIWNTVVRLLVADMAMEILLPSIQCLPLSQTNQPGYSLATLQQSWGFTCPPMSASSSSSALSPTATGLLFGLRLLFVCIGVSVGESFFPIGLTGGIACGKSTVAYCLEHDTDSNSSTDGTVYMVDLDTIAHDVLLKNNPDSVYNEVVRAFQGDDILVDGLEIDRRKLGAIIFASREKRRMLNGITHPRITYVMLKRIVYGIFWSRKDLTVVDVPLLFESGKLRYLFGLTIVVACDSQLERLQKRNSDLSTQQCKDRIASQIPIHTKAEMSNIVIWNNGSMEELEEEVERVREEIMHRVYGVGLSLLQLLIIIGGSVPVAVLSKLYTMRYGGE